MLQVPSWCLVVQLLHSVTGQPPQERLLVAICGITKLFVGDLVETGGGPCILSSSTDLASLLNLSCPDSTVPSD